MPITILLIDDEPRLLKSFARNVRLAGYPVLTAGGGAAGLECYHREQPEIVIVDLRMPDMTGLDVLQAIRAHDPEANVILTSGHGDKDAILEAMRAGASDFLPKPVDQVTLESALRRASERVHLKRELRASQEALRQQNAQLEATVRERTAALRESEAQYRLLVENLGEGVAMVDSEETFTFANPVAEEIFGVARGALLGHNLREWVSAETFAQMRAETDTRRDGQRSVYEFEITRADGERRQLLLTAMPYFAADGEFAGAFGVFRDNTERNRIETALRESEALLNAVGQMAQVGGWELDAETRAVRWTEQTYHIHGVPLDHQPPFEEAMSFYPPEDRRRLTQVLQRALEEGVPYDEELRFINARGEQLWVRAICQPQVVDGTTRALKGTFQDITARKRAETWLRQAQAIFRNISVGLYIYHLEDLADDRTLRMVEVNPAAERITGLKAADILGRTLDENFPGLRALGVPQRYAEVVRTQTAREFKDFMYGDDRIAPAVYMVKAFPLPENHVGIAFDDFTARQQTADALRARTTMLASAEKLAHIGSWTWDIPANRFTLSEGWQRIHGCYINELAQVDLMPIAHPDDFLEVERAFAQALADGVPYNIEHRIIRQDDGAVRYVHAYGEVVYDEFGEPREMYGAVLDITEHKQTVQALQDKETLLQAAFDATQHPFRVINVEDYSIVIANAAYGGEQAMNQTCYEFSHHLTHPCPGDEHICPLARIRESGQPFFTEYRKLDGDGNTQYQQIYAYPVFDAQGRVHQIVEYALDITERKQMELALEENLTRYAELTARVQVGIYIVWIRADGRLEFEYVSDRWCEIHQVCREDALADIWSVHQQVHPDELEAFMARNRQAHHERERFSWEGRFIIGGETRWLQIESTCEVFVNGDTRWFGVTQDITERKQIEDALRESERRHRELAANIPGAVYQFQIQPEGTYAVTYMSRSATELFERPHTDLIRDNPLFEDIHADDRPGFLRSIAEAAQVEQRWSHEFRIITPTGKVKWLRGSSNPRRLPEGSLLWDGVLLDITAHKQAEAQLQEYAERLAQMVDEKVQQLEQEHAKVIQLDKLASLGQLATGIAHELRQPLTAITLDAGYLIELAHTLRESRAQGAESVLDLAELEHIGRELQEDVRRARRIIDHLRGFGRVADEDMPLIDLNQPLEDSLLLIGTQLRDHQVTVTLRLAEDLPLIQANPHKLEQVFINLIGNAEYAMQEAAEQDGRAKTLTLSTRREGAWVIAEVHDNGCGMSEEAQKRLFEPFFTTKPEGQGTGLGLSICHGIVNSAGGEITCQSAPGAGTTFTLRFPVTEE